MRIREATEYFYNEMISNGLQKVIIRDQTQCPSSTETEQKPTNFRGCGAGLSALISLCQASDLICWKELENLFLLRCSGEFSDKMRYNQVF